MLRGAMSWGAMKPSSPDVFRRGRALAGVYRNKTFVYPPWLIVWLTVLVASSCEVREHEEGLPDALVALARVPFALPVYDRAMRIAISEDHVTLDLRPLADRLPGHKRRFVQKAVVSVTGEPVSCDHFASLLELAEELQLGSVLDLEVDQHARAGQIADVLSALSRCSKFQEHRFVLHGSNGIGMLHVNWRPWPRCPAELIARNCAVPYIWASGHGLQLEMSAVPMPTRPKCATGVPRFQPLDESWQDAASPIWHGHILLLEERACPSIPASVDEPLVRLAGLLEEVQRIGPGCEAVTLDADQSLAWGEVARLLAVLRIEAAYEFVRLEIAEHTVPPDCARSLVAGALPTG